jgi:hypothetical protein
MVAVTAIEHGDIIITVASYVREAGLSNPTEGTFMTAILGGPLRGETWAGKTWRMMLGSRARRGR